MNVPISSFDKGIDNGIDIYEGEAAQLQLLMTASVIVIVIINVNAAKKHAIRQPILWSHAVLGDGIGLVAVTVDGSHKNASTAYEFFADSEVI